MWFSGENRERARARAFLLMDLRGNPGTRDKPLFSVGLCSCFENG